MDTCNIVLNPRDIPMGLVELKGTYKYTTREPAPIEEKYYKKRRLLCRHLQSRPSEVLAAIVDAAGAELQDYLAEGYHSSRYISVLPSIPMDRYNNLEILGAMRYSKTRAVIYSFHDKLDYAIAYLFDTPLELVRERLLSNCKQFNINYEILSYAFCSMNLKYLETINLQVILGISDILDSFIMNITWHPQSCVYAVGDAILSLADPSYTTEERITTFMVTKVGYFLQMFINAIVMLFQKEQKPFIGSRSCMLVSKGPSNIVIATAGFNDLPIINFELDSLEPLRVVPAEAYSLGEHNESNWYSKVV